MKKIGIICEYNPFHNGHLHHLNYIKNNFKNSLVILVMSGEVTERGDLSVLTKWEKTKLALDYGIDIVIELPYQYAAQSADLFAKGSLAILNYFQVDKIVFGSEENNPNKLIKYAKQQLDEEYHLKVLNNLKNGDKYAKATAEALEDDNFFKPNDILGLSYIREIIKNNYSIEPLTLKRTNDYNSHTLNDSISSATAIREALLNKNDISKYVPKETFNMLNKDIIKTDDYYELLKYRILNEDINILKYHLVDEKIIPRILKFINKSNNFDELILNIKTKNYSYNRIKRTLMNILFGITKEDIKKQKDYIRILGFNNNGKKYLNQLKKDIDIPIITSYRNNKDNILNINTKIVNVLSIKHKKYLNEFNMHPIIKDN